MKTLLSIETDTADKINLLVRVAEEMGMAVEARPENATGSRFSTIALPGSPLSDEALEKLADEMESDADTLSEKDTSAYLAQLKAVWSKPSL